MPTTPKDPEDAPSVADVLDEMGLPPGAPDPEIAHAAREGPHANETLAETAKDASEQAGEAARRVTKEDLEGFLQHAIRLFLKGGIDVHHEGPAFPDFEIKVTEDTIVLNVRRLDEALAWNLASGPADVAPPEPEPEQVLDRFRLFLLVEDEPVVALGRGIPGVQVRAGKASYLLFKDLVKGVLADKSAAERAKDRAYRRELLEREIAHSRERADAVVPELEPPEVEPGEERLPGPSFAREGR